MVRAASMEGGFASEAKMLEKGENHQQEDLVSSHSCLSSPAAAFPRGKPKVAAAPRASFSVNWAKRMLKATSWY